MRQARCTVVKTIRFLLLVSTVLVPVSTADAQARPASRVSTSVEQMLDAWIVHQYRGAQLLTDSSAGERTIAADTPIPRVEHVRDSRGDSIVGVHFSARAVSPSLALAGTVRLAVPSGTVTNTTGKVVARRLFRAPRIPGAAGNSPTAWRYGWAYLVVLPRQRDRLPALATRGWLLLDGTPPDTRTRRSRP